MRLVIAAVHSPLRDGSTSTLKSELLSTDGTRRPIGFAAV
jgi:hypothetical protein